MHILHTKYNKLGSKKCPLSAYCRKDRVHPEFCQQLNCTKSSPKVQTENIPAHRHSWPQNWTQNTQKSSKTWYFIPSPKIRTMPRFFRQKLKHLQYCNLCVVWSGKLHRSNCLWCHSESDRRLKRWHKQARVSCEIGHRASRNRPPPTSKIEK